MRKYIISIIVSASILILSIITIVTSTIKTPGLEELKQSKYDRLNENVEDLRFDNVVWPTQNGVDALRNIGINIDFEEQELSRNNYVEIPHSVVILYGNERYFIKMDDFTSVVYSTTSFGLVDHYVRYYFTVGGERIKATSFEVITDPKNEFDYWHSQSELDDYRIEYYDEYISNIQRELDFLSVGADVAIVLIILTIPVIFISSRRLYLYSGFETIELAKDHYKKLNDLKSKKRKIDNKKKSEDKQKKRLQELEKLKEELQESNNE